MKLEIAMTINLNTTIGRVVFSAVAGVISLILAMVVFTHFRIRFLADSRIAPTSEALLSTVELYDYSPRIHYRLAQALMASAMGDENSLRYARAHAVKAVELSPWNYSNRLFAASLLELSRDIDGAEKLFEKAIRLAPFNANMNWQYANFLVRRSRLRDSLEYFRKASARNESVLPQTFEILYQASNGNISIIKEMVNGKPDLELSLVRFLIEKSSSQSNLINDAIAVFRSINQEFKVESPKSALFIQSLIGVDKYDSARAVWTELMRAKIKFSGIKIKNYNISSPNPIWNAGFEIDPIKNFDQFDWTFSESEFASFGIDDSTSRSGMRSLRVSFTGRDTTVLKGEVKQLVSLKPSSLYRLECWVKTGDLTTPEGPRLAIISKGGVIAQTESVIEEASEWYRLYIDFKAPPDYAPAYVTVIRTPKYAYDDPSKGSVWFDDFSLTELNE